MARHDIPRSAFGFASASSSSPSTAEVTVPASSTIFTQPGHGLIQQIGAVIPVQINDAGVVLPAKADSPSTLASGFVTEISGDDLTVQFSGRVEVGPHGKGFQAAWLSPNTAGATRANRPGGDAQVQLLWQHVSPTEIELYRLPGFEAGNAEVEPHQFTSASATVEAGETWIITDTAHVMTLPSDAQDGESVVFIPQAGPWSNGLYSIVSQGSSTIGQGPPVQGQFADDYDSLEFTFRASTDDWGVSN